jgi:hypothetical protein
MNISVYPSNLSPVEGAIVQLTCSGLGFNSSSSITWKFYPTSNPLQITIIYSNGAYQNNPGLIYNVVNTDLPTSVNSILTWTSSYQFGTSYTYECACTANCGQITKLSDTANYTSISMKYLLRSIFTARICNKFNHIQTSSVIH